MSSAETSHPLDEIGIHVSSFKCFDEQGGGVAKFQPINVIIGRNNVGKSTIIDAIELCVSKGQSYQPGKHKRTSGDMRIDITQRLDIQSLHQIFPMNAVGGSIGGNHWEFGKRLIDRPFTRAYAHGWTPTFRDPRLLENVPWLDVQEKLATATRYPFESVDLVKISAERDIVPEMRDHVRNLQPNGTGATNLVRAFINSDDLPRDAVEVDLLRDLNLIYSGDCQFQSIICREDPNQNWEIFLREDGKGDIRLSQSGSSLKTIFITLCVFHLLSQTRNIDWKRAVLSIEEPENNLHPALLRRFLYYLSSMRDRLGFSLIIATHSPITIDWASRREDSQVLHVQHSGAATTVRSALGYSESRGILDDLDIRASDILQANGVIWVEGPSDRIYLKRWLTLITQGQLQEGVHYNFMFYGGRLLSHFDCLPPNQSEQLVSLMAINRNAALVMDSDRHRGYKMPLDRTGKQRTYRPRMQLNDAKLRIKGELETIGGLVWVTYGREIENYVSLGVFRRLLGYEPKAIDLYDEVEKVSELDAYGGNKIKLAHALAEETTIDDLNCYDLTERLTALVAAVRSWNAIIKA